MPMFRKRPVEVEAHLFTPDIGEEIAKWCFGTFHPDPVSGGTWGSYLIIPTLEGDMKAEEGDWIVRGIKGEFYPVKPDIFEATYERV